MTHTVWVIYDLASPNIKCTILQDLSLYNDDRLFQTMIVQFFSRSYTLSPLGALFPWKTNIRLLRDPNQGSTGPTNQRAITGHRPISDPWFPDPIHPLGFRNLEFAKSEFCMTQYSFSSLTSCLFNLQSNNNDCKSRDKAKDHNYSSKIILFSPVLFCHVKFRFQTWYKFVLK